MNHVGVGGVALTVGLVVGVRFVLVEVAGVSLVLVEVVGGRSVLVEAGIGVVDLSFYEKGNRIIRRNAITEFNCNCLVMRILCYWESLNS